jgi:hypothetical protein
MVANSTLIERDGPLRPALAAYDILLGESADENFHEYSRRGKDWTGSDDDCDDRGRGGHRPRARDGDCPYGAASFQGRLVEASRGSAPELDTQQCKLTNEHPRDLTFIPVRQLKRS